MLINFQCKWQLSLTYLLTSLECNCDDNSLCSPDELNVQWNESAAGDASTRHFNCNVSCFKAPESSSWSAAHTGASGMREFFVNALLLFLVWRPTYSVLSRLPDYLYLCPLSLLQDKCIHQPIVALHSGGRGTDLTLWYLPFGCDVTLSPVIIQIMF